MMFERFTNEARSAVVLSQEAARRLQHRYIGTEHLLLALLNDDGVAGQVLGEAGITRERAEAAIERYLSRGKDGQPFSPTDAEALRSIGIDVDEVRARIEEHFGPIPLEPPVPPVRRRFSLRRDERRTTGPVKGHIPFTARAKKVLELSLREALRLKSKDIRTEHMLLGLLREGEGLAALVLVQHGNDLDALRRQIEQRLRPAA
jgi:ATP-dependent Clp protease ATP-binding subunit ClpA